MKNNAACFLFFFAMLSNVTLFAQRDEDQVIGKIGDRIIYASEFLQRCEFNPYLGRTQNDPNDAYKYETLITLISEKLLAQQAEKIGLDTSTFVSVPARVIEKMTVRDALYKDKISGGISILQSEFKQGIERYFTEKFTTMYYFNSEKNAKSFYDKIINNSAPPLSAQDSSYEVFKQKIVYGHLDKSIEDVVYNLDDNKFSKPLLMNNNWAIFRSDSSKSIFTNDKKKLLKAENEVNKILKSRVSESQFDKYLSKFFEDKNIKANATLFKYLINLLSESLSKKKFISIQGSDSIFVINNKSIYELKDRIEGDKLEADFIAHNDGKIKLKDFLDELGYEGFNYSLKDSLSLEHRFNLHLKKYMRNELLAAEGYKFGYNYLPEVKKNVSMWRDYYLATAMKEYINHGNNFVDSSYFYNNGYIDNSAVSDSVNSELKSMLSLYSKDKQFLELIKQTIELADAKGIEINKNAVDSVNISYINMFVFRYFGFGGRLPAAPPTRSFTEWYKFWRSKNMMLF